VNVGDGTGTSGREDCDMAGLMIIYDAAVAVDAPPDIKRLDGPPSYRTLHDVVDDGLERVGFFNSIVINGEPCACVAFCGEHGKQRELPVNSAATIQWSAAVNREIAHLDARALLRPQPVFSVRHGQWLDYLAGTVVVLVGDKDFMQAI
jgi:hypothetical protein